MFICFFLSVNVGQAGRQHLFWLTSISFLIDYLPPRQIPPYSLPPPSAIFNSSLHIEAQVAAPRGPVASLVIPAKPRLLPDLFHPISRLVVAADAPPAVPLWNSLNEPTFGSGPPLIPARREGDECSSNECQASLLYLWVNIVWLLKSPVGLSLWVNDAAAQMLG